MSELVEAAKEAVSWMTLGKDQPPESCGVCARERSPWGVLIHHSECWVGRLVAAVRGGGREGAVSNLTAEIEARCLYLGEIEVGGEETVCYLSDQFVNGRQRYRCAHCYRWIEKGERQRSIRAVVDEDFLGSVRYCAECCVAQYEDDRAGGYEALVARIEGAKTIEAWLARVAEEGE